MRCKLADLCSNFQRKYPYHFEDFVSDHSDSTRYVAYNFAKRQMQRMNMGICSYLGGTVGEREDVAFRAVEKEFLAELDSINAQLFDDVPPEQEGVAAEQAKKEETTEEATKKAAESESEGEAKKAEDGKDAEGFDGEGMEGFDGEGMEEAAADEETHVNDAELYKVGSAACA